MNRSHIALVLAATMAICLTACDKDKSANQFDGRSISHIEIRLTGEKWVDEHRIRTLIVSKPGDKYTPEALDADIKSLFESGLVDDVRFLAELDGERVRLIAEVSARPGFGPPFCIGNTAFSDKRLGDASGLSKERPITVESLMVAKGRLKDYYVKHGYPDVTVECRAFNGGDPSPDDLTFVVVEGSPTAAERE